MSDETWVDVGGADELKHQPVQQVLIGRTPVALTYCNEQFGAINGACNHVGGPLGEGTLEGEYVVCPWHYWKFHKKLLLDTPQLAGGRKRASPRSGLSLVFFHA